MYTHNLTKTNEISFNTHLLVIAYYVQGGSNMTGTDLCVNKPQSVPVIFEPPCIYVLCNIVIFSSLVHHVRLGDGLIEKGRNMFSTF